MPLPLAVLGFVCRMLGDFLLPHYKPYTMKPHLPYWPHLQVYSQWCAMCYMHIIVPLIEVCLYCLYTLNVCLLLLILVGLKVFYKWGGGMIMWVRLQMGI